MQHASECMAKYVHPNTTQNKNKRFSVLAWHGLYEYEVDARQWLQYTQFPHCTIKKSRK